MRSGAPLAARQAAADHISMRVNAPTSTASRSSCAYSRSAGGIKRRPCASRLASSVCAKRWRTKVRYCASLRGALSSLAQKSDHAASGYMARHGSGGAIVNTKCSPRRERRRAGIVKRPFSSRECSYCPVNFGRPLITKVPRPTLSHFDPLYPTYRQLVKWDTAVRCRDVSEPTACVAPAVGRLDSLRGTEPRKWLRGENRDAR